MATGCAPAESMHLYSFMFVFLLCISFYACVYTVLDVGYVQIIDTDLCMYNHVQRWILSCVIC